MTRVFYAGVELQIVGTLDYEMTAVRDGPTYLYTRHKFRFSAIFNPAATAWTLPGAQGVTVKAGDEGNGQSALMQTVQPGQSLGPPRSMNQSLVLPNRQPPSPFGGSVFNSGAWPVVTKEALQHALSQSRQRLVVTTKDGSGADHVLLLSPAIRADQPGGIQSDSLLYPCDATGGPHSTVTSIKMLADKTFFVTMTLETCLTQTDLFRSSSSINALLSHHWLSSQDVDQDGYATRHVRGRAIFRRDRLDLLQASPDDYRAWLLHPCPLGMQRGRLHVQVSDDNTALLYSFVDRQVAVTIIYPGVTRIECWFERTRTFAGTDKIMADAFFTGSRIAGGYAQAAVATTLSAGLGAQAAYTAATLQAVAETAGLAIRSVPQLTSSVHVRVWGNPSTKRIDLYKCALAIAQRKLGGFEGITGESSATVREDCMGTYVEYTQRVINGVTANVGVLIGALSGMEDAIDDTNQMTPVTTVTPAGVNTVAFPNDPIPGAGGQGSRGTFVQGIAAAALYGSCVDPNQPTNPSTPLAKTPTYSTVPVQPAVPTQGGIPVIP